MNAVVEVKNLTKEYKQKKAVDDLSFEIRQGEIVQTEVENQPRLTVSSHC